ncbi:Aristolochene synthase in complex with 12,13 Difluorofarnesyl diphosphate [Mycena rebaudengoi]|nr:Aristolochene synthase in complex with 12,13 Difluorofarnesyl diphosphate [Mycena rebaudengoi]
MEGVRPTTFAAKIHPHFNQIAIDLDKYFLEHWPFPNKKARQKFVDAKFAYALCIIWPESIDERMVHACFLVTLLFLVDDVLDSLPLDEGREYNTILWKCLSGNKEPNRDIPVEWIAYDVGERMRSCDPVLADDVFKEIAVFMRAQTDPIRLKEDIQWNEYLAWRILDIGGPFLTATGLYCTGLTLPEEDMALVAQLNDIWVKQIIYCNDAWSYDKEEAARKANMDGGVPNGSMGATAVSILMGMTGVTADAAKHTLICLAREMEALHESVASEVLAKKATPELQKYIKMLEYQMSGNENWSNMTSRYTMVLEST